MKLIFSWFIVLSFCSFFANDAMDKPHFNVMIKKFPEFKMTSEIKTIISTVDQKTLPFYISAKELYIINRALTMRPDRFSEWYYKLSEERRQILKNVSLGNFIAPIEPKHSIALPLYVPALRQKFFGTIFSADISRTIKNFTGDSAQDEENKNKIIAYCARRLLRSKSLVLEKTKLFTSDNDILKEIDMPSLCMNCYYTAQSFFTKPFSWKIDESSYDVHAITQDTQEYEYYIINSLNQNPHAQKEYYYNLCILNSSKNSIFSDDVKHTAPLKGVIFAKDLEGKMKYVITYSQEDCTIITLLLKKEFEQLRCTIVSILNNQTELIKDIVFDEQNDFIWILSYNNNNLIALLRGYNPATANWFSATQFNFFEYGFPKKIFFSNRNISNTPGYINRNEQRCLGILFDKIKKSKESYFYWNSNTQQLYYCNANNYTIDRLHIFEDESNCFIFDFNAQLPLFKNNKNCITYSSDGKFLLKNFLQKDVIHYIMTQLIDRKTNEILLNFKRISNIFTGNGISQDGKKLLFLGHTVPNTEVDIDCSRYTQELDEFIKYIMQYKDLGILSYIKKLCDECDKNGVIQLQKNDPARQMLQGWYNNKQWIDINRMKKFFEVCFPINKLNAS